jgi:hypothetical protein
MTAAGWSGPRSEETDTCVRRRGREGCVAVVVPPGAASRGRHGYASGIPMQAISHGAPRSLAPTPVGERNILAIIGSNGP